MLKVMDSIVGAIEIAFVGFDIVESLCGRSVI